MSIHRIILDAIVTKQSLTATSCGVVYILSPHVLGRDRGGAQIMIAYEHVGEDTIDAGGRWHCLQLLQLESVSANGSKWRRGHGKPPEEQIVRLEAGTF